MNSSVTEHDQATQNKLQKLLSLLAHDPENRVLRGECVSRALQQRNYELAQNIAEQALRRDPVDAQAIFERASALMGLRQFDSALAELSSLTQSPEPDPAVLQNIGLCHYLLGNYVAARAPLEAAYARGVRSVDLLRLLISILHHLGAIEEALQVASAAAELASDDGAIAGVLAILYLDADQPAQAARWSARAVAANPNSVDGLVVQGTLRAGVFDLGTARQQFEKALAIAPATARAWIGLSLVSLAENDFVMAKSQIEQGLHYMPQHVGSWHILAWIDLMQGKLDEARVIFERALSMDRNFAESHGGLAAIAALRGDRGAAERYAQVAERLNPNCLSAKFARSTLMKGQGDVQGARDTLVKALSGLSRNGSDAMSRVVNKLKNK